MRGTFILRKQNYYKKEFTLRKKTLQKIFKWSNMHKCFVIIWKSSNESMHCRMNGGNDASITSVIKMPLFRDVSLQRTRESLQKLK